MHSFTFFPALLRQLLSLSFLTYLLTLIAFFSHVYCTAKQAFQVATLIQKYLVASGKLLIYGYTD